MMHAMREMMAKFMSNNGRSESSSAEGSAAVAGSPPGAEPTAARETPAVAVAGGVARGDTTAGSETTLREDASRTFGVAGRRGAAVPVEVGPATGQPDQQRRAGEWDSYVCGELGGGYDLLLSRHLASKPTAFSGQNPEFTAWTRDALHYAKGVGCLPLSRIHLNTFP